MLTIKTLVSEYVHYGQECVIARSNLVSGGILNSTEEVSGTFRYLGLSRKSVTCVTEGCGADGLVVGIGIFSGLSNLNGSVILFCVLEFFNTGFSFSATFCLWARRGNQTLVLDS